MIKLQRKVLLLSTILSLFLPVHLYVYAEPYLAPDVVIDVGHGGIDGGTSSSGVLEKDINLEVGLKLFNELNKKSFNVGITRINDATLSDESQFTNLSRHMRDLKQRMIIANTLKPRVFISLHVNWSKNKKRRGPVIIYQVSEKSLQLAHLVQGHLNEYYGVNKNPFKGNPYFLMKHLDMPSIIVELGYLSNSKDFGILTDEESQGELVDAMVRAVEEYFMLYPHENVTDTVNRGAIFQSRIR
ncbi:N-acetylmuramoyl-L-alanine amidase [Anaerobacillus sp. MEB173]|uniref:N-acetylmuramoyl-L-alanine amidase family protein n=1 Tax=Anaerobacillus sp. MEB173 TaxID=3383345 RepID=UPI003F9286F0